MQSRAVQGVVLTATAFAIWGIAPLYFKLVAGAPVGEILAHRILWACVLLFGVLVALRKLPGLAQLWRDRRTALIVTAACVFISINWLIFLWAVVHDRVLETSLGYFINPLVNVLLGVVFLHERLRSAQVAAVAIAALGVGYLVIHYGSLPWVSIVLPITFGMYGLMKKMIGLDALTGLFAETVVMAPFSLVYVIWLTIQGRATFAIDPYYTWMLPIAGLFTSIPLVCFGAGARRIQLSTIGFIQYLAPTITFFLAVFAFHEPFGRAQLVTFTLIWISLAVYTVDSLHASNQRRRARLEPIKEAT